jgi:hypothetical protein
VILLIPAQFKKLLSELEQLTDMQVRQVETFLKGDDLVQPIITQLEQWLLSPLIKKMTVE